MKHIAKEIFALTLGLVWFPNLALAQTYTKGQVEQDLVLEAKLKTKKTIGPGSPIKISCRIANRSEKNTYAIVKPGDGSEMGWREPHVYFSAMRLDDTGEQNLVLRSEYQRAAVFDTDWNKDIVTLGPSEEISIENWIVQPHMFLEIQEEGVYKIFLHYRFRQGKRCRKKAPSHAEALAQVSKMPAYELTSQPIIVIVKRPLDVVIEIKSPLKVKSQTSLSSMMDVSLINKSSAAYDVTPPNLFRDPRLSFEIKGEFESFLPRLTRQTNVNKTMRRLAPKEKLPILGEGRELGENIDGTWEYPIEETVMLRAIYNASQTDPYSIVLKSRWVRVKVVQ